VGSIKALTKRLPLAILVVPIMNFQEELIGRDEMIENVLRFLILTSLCQGGISSKKYDLIKREIIEAYGIKHLVTLDLCEQYQVLSRYETLKKLIQGNVGYFNWNQVRKNFQLIKSMDDLLSIISNNQTNNSNDNQNNQNQNTNNPNNNMTMQEKENSIVNDPSMLGMYDINIIGNGYAPLSTRLIEAATKPNGWKGILNDIEQLPGKMYEEKFFKDINNIQTNAQSISNYNDSSNFNQQKTVLVFYVGGVTYSEISAIRMLENRPNSSWKFIIGTTNIANGNRLVNAFIDPTL